MALHTFSTLGRNIIYDTQTEAILAVDKLALEIFENISTHSKDQIFELLKGQYPQQDIEETYAEIEQLVKDGIVKPGADLSVGEITYPKPVIKAMCLHVSHDCDLRCNYCFASQGDFKGARQLMSLETGKKALEFLVENSGNRKNLEVDFFGGEPLMNFDVVKELTLYGQELNKKHDKNIRFTITTNGLMLDDDKIDFINEHMVNVVMSLDGRPEVHDRMRPTVNQKGSYEIVKNNFKRLLEKRGEKSSYIRGTFTGYNLDFDKDVLHFFDEGFESVSMEPVVTDESLDYAIQREDLPEVLESYERLALAYKERKDQNPALQFFHFMVDLSNGPCLAKKRSGCGAGVEYVAITPSGDIYPCHQFVGEEDFLLGTLETGIVNTQVTDDFAKARVDEKDACQTCWNQNFCSGGCHANAYYNHGTILKPYEIGCEMQKKRTECALAIQVDANDEV